MAETRGFALITVLLVALAAGAVAALAHFQILALLETSSRMEGRLHSLVLAENGVEWAKSVLAAGDIDDPSAGLDDHVDCGAPAEWRNPVPFEVARRTPFGEVSLDCDAGLPRSGGRILWPAYPSSDGGVVLVRFSSDPREPRDFNQEAIVVVRSMGLVPLGAAARRGTGLANQVSLVEAHLRQFRPFPVLGAVTLLGPGGDFEWVGDEFRIDGGERPGIALLSYPGEGLAADLEASLDPDPRSRISGAEPPILEADESDWRGGDLVELLTTDLASRLMARLVSRAALFSPSDGGPSPHVLPEGGTIGGSLRGLVVAAGDLTLEEGSHVEGLLVHLGGGVLRIQGPAGVTGALWVASLEERDGETTAGRIRLSISGQASVTHDADWVRVGLSLLPPEQLLWRILFPEMRM